ncbi:MULTISPECIES: hypothetical protein [Hyphobacterium]|uniref:Uncharacterized protein n=1 Tax=Hyphobacterium vulgare TaxID=1736751 RepID=A0ABV6ZUT6_9PROT
MDNAIQPANSDAIDTRWVELREFSSEQAVLRFPDFWDHELPDKTDVLEIVITAPRFEPGALDGLNEESDGWLVVYPVADGIDIEVVGGRKLSLKGERVTLSRQTADQADLVRALRSMRRDNKLSQAEAHAAKAKLRTLASLITEELRRAEIKAASSADRRKLYASEIAFLNRALKMLDEG